MKSLTDKLHHLFYVLGAIAIAVLAYHFFAPVRDHALIATSIPTQAPFVPPAGDIHREVQAYLDSQALNAALHSPVAAPGAMPAINVVMPALKGFSAAEVGALLHAAGTQKTQPVIHVGIIGPTPGPVITPPPDISKDDAAFHHADTYNAVAEALKETQVKVSVTQDPVPPSRVESLVTANHAAGIVYAFKRRGQVDLDLGVLQKDGSTAPVAGLGYRLKGTQAGAFAGLTVSGHHPAAAIGFTISF